MGLFLAWSFLLFSLNLIYSKEMYGDDIDIQNLHKQMTQEELIQLFGSGYEEEVPEYQIIHITEAEKLNYNFSAFGKFISLQLQPNEHLMSPHFKTILRDHDYVEELNGPDKNCYFLHSDATSSAALSLCNQNGLNGIVFLTDDTFEIQPLTPRLHSILGGKNRIQEPHLVKRAPLFNSVWSDEKFLPQEIIASQEEVEPLYKLNHKQMKRSSQRPVVEVALFFDEAGYKLFQPYLHNDDKQLRDMLLAYINGVQALYHHPSVGQPVDIALTRLEVFKSQPADLPHYGGERGLLLDSFCSYNAKHNPPGDEKPEHWDMGLYVSGLDFYAVEHGQRSGVTMGLATVGGVCMDKYACIIAELGTTNVFGKPYPSAGFTSVYILAHEIGHNLGMHHDSSSNSCPSEGYIMSPSRGTNGETQWSTCSAEVMRKLSSVKCLLDKPSSMPSERDHNKMHDAPGQLWGAKRQCEVLLKDKDAELQSPDKTEEMCINLQCRTPHRSGYYFAGPALEGTACAPGKWCQGGECVVMKKPKPEHVTKGGWSKWITEDCLSGCITKSKGHQKKHRECNNPKPVNTEEGCEGPSFDVILCKDEKVCKKSKRKSTVTHAKEKCAEFSKILPILNPKSSGLQAPHEEGRKWVACAIFCSRKDTGSFYTPRLDLNDLDMDPYFPDGTWCHNDGKHNYYCMHHQCLPENFRGAKSLFDLRTDDVALPQNALPHHLPLPEVILKYLSLDSEGRPLLTKIKNDGIEKPLSDDIWASKDYLELPPM